MTAKALLIICFVVSLVGIAVGIVQISCLAVTNYKGIKTTGLITHKINDTSRNGNIYTISYIDQYGNKHVSEIFFKRDKNIGDNIKIIYIGDNSKEIRINNIKSEIINRAVAILLLSIFIGIFYYLAFVKKVELKEGEEITV